VSLAIATALLAACSNATRFNDGPTWSLTGGKDAAPPPPGRVEPTYRGGRDPATGRAVQQQGAMAPGAPAGNGQYIAPPPRPYDQAPAAQPGAVPARGVAGATYAQLGTNTYARKIVTVQPGDSLASVAAAHRVSIASLMFANNLRDAYVSPGQQLVIPPR
jgi:hypothetical protein